MTILTCSVDECAKPASSRGWCQAHYYRNRRHGHPLGLSALRGRTHMERFDQYAVMQPSGCREWQGGKLTDDYGSFRYENKSWPAHRWIWVQVHGAIPAGMVVRHKCDNPPCANIGHLELGSPADNMLDMVERDRSLKGSKNAIAKLDEASVRGIRIAFRDKTSTQLELAAEHGVTPQCINGIIRGRSWKHVTIEAA